MTEANTELPRSDSSGDKRERGRDPECRLSNTMVLRWVQRTPFAGMTRIRFDGYALGSALSAPLRGSPVDETLQVLLDLLLALLEAPIDVPWPPGTRPWRTENDSQEVS